MGEEDWGRGEEKAESKMQEQETCYNNPGTDRKIPCVARAGLGYKKQGGSEQLCVPKGNSRDQESKAVTAEKAVVSHHSQISPREYPKTCFLQGQ